MTDTIEGRLRRVEDELAIARLLHDYSAFLDGRDYAAYVALFAPDGAWTNADGSWAGRAAIHAMLVDTVGPPGRPGSGYHLNSNARIDLDGDRATAVSRYLFMLRGADGRPKPVLAGIYHDEFERGDDGWKIRRRVAEEVIPTHAEWMAMGSAPGARE